MIKLNYSGRKLKRREVVVLWSEVEDGTYRELMQPIYQQNRNDYLVEEYREGLVIDLPSEVVDSIELKEFVFPAKSKIKLTEVFKLCQKELSTHKAH